MANKGKKFRPATGAPETETFLTTGTTLDLKGLKCPLPVLKTRKALTRLSSGEQLTVLTTDPMAEIDIPHFCNEQGHTLLEAERIEGGHRFVLTKGG